MTKTKVVQICGTGSDVGKSVIVTALCRIFLEDGFSICPFKAQNMSLNSYVTKEGGEMGRAQVVQAQACRIEPDVDMNPILIKPTSDTAAQIILQGRSIANISARKYQNKRLKTTLLKNVKESFMRLKKRYEVIVIEGAGSPAEINLKSHDIVNMKMAEFANASVILVGDIDKGGVFASLIGTLELLNKKERQRIKGFIINKFRGDKELLKDGIRFLEKRTKKPVLGVIPYFNDIKIPQEDSVILELKTHNAKCKTQNAKLITVGVIKLPHMSNFTDFDVLENESDVNLVYIEEKKDLNCPDIIIIPGTKNTIEDLIWLKNNGLAETIFRRIDSSKKLPLLIGICGGYQMLGKCILDPQGIESPYKEVNGLGLLPIKTIFQPEKILAQTEAIQIKTGMRVKGYEIHHGKTIAFKPYIPMFRILNSDKLDGACSKDNRIWGTYLHGVFDSPTFRRHILNNLRRKKGLKLLSIKNELNLEQEFDKLARLVRKNIKVNLLYEILNHKL